MTVSFGDLRKGMTIELDGRPYEVLEYERVKMQQRAPVVRLKLRDLKGGRVIERSFQSYHTEFPLAEVEYRPAQYLYNDGQLYYFMDNENYDQYHLTREQLGGSVHYLKEELSLELVFFKGEPISVKLPITVDLKVVSTPPGVKGDTAQGGGKPATLETGLTIQVPFFVSAGEVVRVDTRTGEYVERVG
jgi:elongation factor P